MNELKDEIRKIIADKLWTMHVPNLVYDGTVDAIIEAVNKHLMQVMLNVIPKTLEELYGE